uniref:anion permease n=1 Tax=Escherichia coli TaxID=562 RepID=UPI0035A1C010
MNKKSLWKLILILAIPCIIGFMPAPAGLSELAWVLFGIYLAAIVGLVIKPGNDSNLLIVFYVQIMPDDFVMQLHRF